MADHRELTEDLDAWTWPNCGTGYLLNTDHDPMLESTMQPHHGAAATTEQRHLRSADMRAGPHLTERRGSDAWPSQEHRRAADHGQKPDDADDQAGRQ